MGKNHSERQGMSESYTTEELRQEAHRLTARRSEWTWEKLALFALGNAERAEIDRLRTPASRVTEGDVAHAIVCLETIVGGSHFGKAFSADEIIRVIQSLASRLWEMTQSRDDFISDNKRLIGEKMEAKSALQSTNARLEQARAALERMQAEIQGGALVPISEWNITIAERDELRAVLKPFADACAKADASSEEVRRAGMGNGHSDDATPGWGIRYKHLKAALAALSPKEQG